MALVKCPECGRERVSDTAEACPDCGYNVRAHYERVKEENEKRLEEEKETASKEESISEKQNEWMESGRYLENGFQIQQKDIILMSVLGIITILLLVGIVCYTNIKASNSEKQKYCYIPSVEIKDNSSEQEFLEAILKCKV